MEIVELEEGLECRIMGLEDLIIDRLNACKHSNFQADCEMVELLLMRYKEEIDWEYIEKKASRPENDTLEELLKLKSKVFK